MCFDTVDGAMPEAFRDVMACRIRSALECLEHFPTCAVPDMHILRRRRHVADGFAFNERFALAAERVEAAALDLVEQLAVCFHAHLRS